MNKASRAEALERFERQTALPMLVLALAIIPLLVIPLVFELSDGAERTVLALEWFIWAAFALEYGIRLFLAPAKWLFVKSNKIDLVVIVLPFLRPLRVMRSARALRLLRAARAAAAIGRSLDAAKDVLTRHKLHYALAVTIGVVVSGAALIEPFERTSADANIKTFPDALWWALTTVTTVGYGDRFPVSAAGRAIAVVLMIIGIALFGLLAGSLASFFVENREEEKMDPQLGEINHRLARIEAALGLDGNEEETRKPRRRRSHPRGNG